MKRSLDTSYPYKLLQILPFQRIPTYNKMGQVS